ncbi:hypothetical protein [Wolbachia endosymbiont of Litomosoides brasiliensis]|nr:hypothetical protein [Wolbachia endosymbiont of Litomosoides brasiliensis]
MHISWEGKVNFNQYVEASALKVLGATVDINKLVSFLKAISIL